eukprot:TRINITY_DN32519_c0_g1_i1.p1 TRINITY_DN32519_c0_g1~~TRINITY_DN32519_c0_g1_i1.p1  ORF type:complete len:709 (+),score=269.16 TRINITY_DN32519_c0_g1_i1:284-2128(+)
MAGLRAVLGEEIAGEEATDAALTENLAKAAALVEADGREYEALCLLKGCAALAPPPAGGGEQAALLTRLDAHTRARLARAVGELPLLQLTDRAFDADAADPQVAAVCGLWRVASHLHAEHAALLPGGDPVEVFAANFLKEFRYHFEGALPTADVNHPEWALNYAQKVMAAHWSLFRVLGAASHPGHAFEVPFFKAVLDVLAQRVQCVLAAGDGGEEWFLGTLGCVLRFEQGLSALPLAGDEGLMHRVLDGEEGAARADAWVGFEKQRLNAVLGQSVWSEQCFSLSVPSNLLKYDATKAGRGAVDLAVALDALAEKMTKASLAPAHATRFGAAVFTPCVERFAGAVQELLQNRGTTLEELLIAANSLVHLARAAAGWANSPMFCGVGYFDETGDLLSGLQSRVMQATLARAAACVRDFAAPIKEAEGGVTVWTPVVRALEANLADIAELSASAYTQQLQQFVFDRVEQDITGRVLHYTEWGCKMAVLQHVVALAKRHSLPTPLIDEAMLLLSLDDASVTALRESVKTPDTSAAAATLREHGVTHLGLAECAAVLAEAPPPPRERKRDKVAALVTDATRGVTAQAITSVFGRAHAAPAESREEELEEDGEDEDDMR